MRLAVLLPCLAVLAAGCLAEPVENSGGNDEAEENLPVANPVPPVAQDVIHPCWSYDYMGCEIDEDDVSGHVYLDVRGLNGSYVVSEPVSFTIHLVNGLDRRVNVTWADGHMYQVTIRNSKGEIVYDSPEGCSLFFQVYIQENVSAGASRALTRTPYTWDQRTFGPGTGCEPGEQVGTGEYKLTVESMGGYCPANDPAPRCEHQEGAARSFYIVEGPDT